MPEPAAADAIAFKEALSRFASGVTVVTTRWEQQLHGLTVSAFASVSAAPPRVLVSIGNTTDSLPLIARAGIFAVHILGREHLALGPRFAKLIDDGADLFEGLKYGVALTGAPILADCLAWLDCRVESRLEVGDHTVVIGAVQAVGGLENEGEPLLYYQRAWRALDPLHVDPRSR